jgi:hypothetical protein
MTVFSDKDFWFRIMMSKFVDLDAYVQLSASDLRMQKNVIESYILELENIDSDDIENDYKIAIKVEKLATLEENYDATKIKFEKSISDYKEQAEKIKKMIDDQVLKYN